MLELSAYLQWCIKEHLSEDRFLLHEFSLGDPRPILHSTLARDVTHMFKSSNVFPRAECSIAYNTAIRGYKKRIFCKVAYHL